MKVFKKDKGFFVIENKNTNELLIIPVKMTAKNNELIERVFEWMRTVKANSDADTLPMRPFTKSSWNCQGCPVRATCWPELENGKNYNKGSVNDPAPGVVDLPPLEVPK
jgi:CRISPR/Cas system-associated exonuclease Cas4 (RecB family)